MIGQVIAVVIVGYHGKIYCFLRKYYYIFGFIPILSGFHRSPHNYEIWLSRYSTCSAGF
jgi:disulfide bond formation protein DsbB